MKDPKGAVRKSFFELLNGQLLWETTDVPVSSFRVAINKENNLYVLLTNQDNVPNDSKNDFNSDLFMTVDIVHKTESAASSVGIDTMAGQIMELVMPAKGQTGLVPPDRWQYINIRLDQDITLPMSLNDTGVGIRRILTFKIKVVQN